MKHTYNISEMTCGSCVSKVKSGLLKHPDVLSADVQLNPPQATVEMQRHIPTHELQEKIGHYQITEADGHSMHHTTMEAAEEERGFFQTYKPLLLIVAFITGVSVLTAVSPVSFSFNAFMINFMAGFFLVFSFFKFLDLKGFATSYATYDLLAIRWKAYGYIYPFLELALGIAFLVRFNMTITLIATIIIMGFSSIGVFKSVVDKKKIKCACLGTVFNLSMSTVTIVEDLTMVVMAVVMLWM